MAGLASDEIKAIVSDPREGFDVELKGWADPKSNEGRATIAKGCLALRNNDGGLLLLGFNDDGTACNDGVPADIRTAYHIDTIQEIVSKFASEPFGISIEFIELENQEHPVIVVPNGVRTPVACKSDLPGNGSLLKCHCLYVRTLSSNGVISSSPATYRDWPRITERCFDNREANIGAFVRRHLAGPKLSEAIAAIAELDISEIGKPAEIAILDRGRERFETALAETEHQSLENLGTMQMAVSVEGSGTEVPLTQESLWKIDTGKPRISGWSPWVMFFNADNDFNAYVLDGAWQALLIGGMIGNHADFWRIEPAGKLFHLRILEDDISSSPNRPQPKTALDYHLQVIRIAEFLAVAIHIARALDFDPENSMLNIGCRWTGLSGRTLTSWCDPRYSPVMSNGASKQDEITTSARVPLSTPDSALGQHVAALISPMFALFGGYSMQVEGFDMMIKDFFSRRFG